MNNPKFNLKKAFTMMEIGLGLLIVSILVMLCIPIIGNQVKKTDEYAYYLAFKTVEKMASQIIVFGDPETEVDEDLGYINNNSIIAKILSYFYPKAYAEERTSVIVSYPKYEYDYVRLCLGNTNVSKGSGQTYSQAEIDSISSEPLCVTYKANYNAYIKKRFMCPLSMRTLTDQDVISHLQTTYMTSNDYCHWVAEHCSGDANSYTVDDLSYCVVTVKNAEEDFPEVIETLTDSAPTFDPISCSNYGFFGASLSGATGIDRCSCTSTAGALNNTGYCHDATEGKYPYYIPATATTEETSVSCDFDSFDESSGTCCHANSRYSKALGKCICMDGYTPNDDNTACVASNESCPAGSHMEENHCTQNLPIVSAKRFCQLVHYNWNTSKNNCDVYTTSEGVDYYSDLYNAITANGTPYLSAKAVVGAFNDVEPNIIFANGLRMWILDDKSASIPGLSFNPADFEPTVNTCKVVGNSEDSCSSSIDFYCPQDSKCFTINQGNGTSKLSDARNCCSTTDFKDIMSNYAASDYLRVPITYAISGFTVFVDINGTKDNDELGGGGTLWKDVFPFYISTNGRVYPGYPLNASKANVNEEGSKDSSSLYQGGNSSALSSDVYYFDMVNGQRKKIIAYPSVPYARALCLSKNISEYTPYCLNLGTKFRTSGENPCLTHRCFIKLKNKIKYL